MKSRRAVTTLQPGAIHITISTFLHAEEVLRPLPEVFKALADPTRLRIVRLLDGAELHVNALVEILWRPQPTVSRHLAVLLRAGLVNRRRDGLWTFYSLNAASDSLGDAG